MHQLTNVVPIDHYKLALTFASGEQKIADLRQYLNVEAFLPLQNQAVFNAVANKEYFVEWLDGDVDLSADTLWHIGVPIDHEHSLLLA